MEIPENLVMIIFGATGDLTKRKLVPSLFDLYCKRLLPEKFAIVGTGRTAFTDDSFRDKMKNDITTFSKDATITEEALNAFLKNIYFYAMDANDPVAFRGLKEKIQGVDRLVQAEGRTIYYLATSPKFFLPIARHLAAAGMTKEAHKKSWTRIVIEKPFGFDLQSAQELNESLQQFFGEQQIYRIDHYLGKETVQNILAFRFANGIFEPLWNRNYIHHVEITAAEHLGVEDRGGYYDSSGALRDMVQNHLLQVLSIVAMEPPARFEANALRNEKVKVFQSLCPIRPEDVDKQVVRGQYTESVVGGKKLPSYRDEKNVDPQSQTETFVAMKLFIANWRWGGVPFYIRTGKRLPTRVSEVTIHFKKTPHYLFTRAYESEIAENQLILRLQPDEGILMKFGMKVPGAGFQIKNVSMDFHYSDLSQADLPDAYERLLLDCMLGDASLFSRSDAVEACWKFISPILEAWQTNPNSKLYGYPAGTWGPAQATKLFEPGEDWRYPCKNLVHSGEYCEL